MNLLTATSCTLMLLLCAYGIYLSYQIYHDFRLKYTLYLHYHVVLNNAFGLILFLLNLALEMGFIASADRSMRYLLYRQFQFLMLPVSWFCTYLFALFTTSLVDTAPGKKFKYAYILYGLLSGAALMAGLNYYVETGVSEMYRYLYWVLVVAVFYLIKTGFLWHALRLKGSVASEARRKMIQQVVLVYFAMLTLYYLLLALSQVVPQIYRVNRGLFFAVSIVPLLFMKHYLYRYQLKTSAVEMTTEILKQAKEKFGISRRENEIVRLIVKGKSNREIEDLLFISQKTVKNHVYNIFKKTNVHSRTQLINCFLNMRE